MKRFLSALLVSLAAPSFLSAASITIDDFATTSAQIVSAPTLSTTPVNPNTSVFLAGSAIGGTRTITATRSTPSGTANAFGQQVQVIVSAGEASVSLGAHVEGSALFAWDAGGADLFDGTNDRVEINVVSADMAGVSYTLNLGGVSVSRSAATTGGVLSYAFADFGGVNFNDVTAISLLIEGPTAFETKFDLVQATGGQVSPVPLPASVPLLLVALGTLGVAARKRHA